MYRRSKGSKLVYDARNRCNVDVIGGKRMPCPECAGTGFVCGGTTKKGSISGIPIATLLG